MGLKKLGSSLHLWNFLELHQLRVALSLSKLQPTSDPTDSQFTSAPQAFLLPSPILLSSHLCFWPQPPEAIAEPSLLHSPFSLLLWEAPHSHRPLCLPSPSLRLSEFWKRPNSDSALTSHRGPSSSGTKDLVRPETAWMLCSTEKAGALEGPQAGILACSVVVVRG